MFEIRLAELNLCTDPSPERCSPSLQILKLGSKRFQNAPDGGVYCRVYQQCYWKNMESTLLQSYLFLPSLIASWYQISQFFFFFLNFEDSSNKEHVLEEEGQYTETIPRLGQFTELIITSGGSSPDQDFNYNSSEVGYVRHFKIFY